MRRSRALFHRLILALSLALAACGGEPPVPGPATNPAPTAPPGTPPAPPVPGGAGTVRLTGRFHYSDPLLTVHYSQHAVALFDLYGFVTRDREWTAPAASQVLGPVSLNAAARLGEYSLLLPALPAGQPADVDHDGDTDEGVQVFAVAYAPNRSGGPFAEGDDALRGWPTYLASVHTDGADDEIIGGKLLAWAPVSGRAFPTDFGPDGRLFTDDDPLGPLPEGYTVVNLATRPFGLLREAEVDVQLLEPAAAAPQDLTNLTYTAAFDRLFEQVSQAWAFNGQPGKAVDWDGLYARIAPRVAQAERDADALAFFKAVQAFGWAIPDGSSGVGTDSTLAQQEYLRLTNGGYGLALRELDDGRALVVYVTPGGPASQAGIVAGAEVTAFDEAPIAEAIGRVEPFSGPFSLAESRRYQQARYLLRAPAGTTASLTFANPGEESRTITLTAINERESFGFTSINRGTDSDALPVEARRLPSGIGYIKLHRTDDDVLLALRLFERALSGFRADGVSHLVLDLRHGAGSALLGLAGYFAEAPITLGQLEVFNPATGQFEPRGAPQQVRPTGRRFVFDEIAVLVGLACAHACEHEAYSLAQLPNVVLVGTQPTAGIAADASRGQFRLPAGLTFQAATGRYVNPDGSLFLEGQGVRPAVWVPVTEETALAADDVVLRWAEDALLGMATDADSLRLEGGPVVVSPSAAESAVSAGVSFLEEMAAENYGRGRLPAPGEAFTYTVNLEGDQRLVWSAGWCAQDEATLLDNLALVEVGFAIDGAAIGLEQFAVFEGPASSQHCRLYYTVVYQWPPGLTQLESRVTLHAPLNDGARDHAAGTHAYVYNVRRP